MNRDQVQRLASAWLDGRIDESDSAALQQALLGSREVRDEFRRWTQLDALLRDQADSRDSHWSPFPAAAPQRRTLRFALAALAAVALSAMLWFRSPSPAPLEATASGVAMLSQALDAQFEQTPILRGDAIVPGRIRLAKGLAQIDFFSGATALVEGPCEIEIISAWEARCVDGRVRVHVPPAAKGFILHAPDMKLEDLGTEFALNVQGQTSAVHVFEGEVIAHTSQPPASLKQGMTLGSTAREFLPVGELQSLVKQREARRLSEWQAWSLGNRRDPRLIAYYTFKHWEDDRWERLVNNLTEPRRPQRAGGIVGARWTQGRWPGKEALEFKRPGDRVRLHLDGSYGALTMACWVKVDSVDKKYSGLLLTDGYDNGKPHWQIHEDGSLMFSIIYRPEDAPRNGRWNQMYFSKPVLSADSLGRWHHIAVTYDGQSGEVIQYFDGLEVGHEISPLHRPGRPLSFGPCEIGNWGLPTEGHPFPIRNLNGAIDEFAIYREVLVAGEIRELFLHGQPE